MRDVGGAVWEQYSGARDQLQQRLVLSIRASMDSLVGDPTRADLLLVSTDGQKLPAHKCILRHRAPGFYRKHVEPTVSAAKNLSANAQLEVAIGDVDFARLEFFIRSIYTDEEVGDLDISTVSDSQKDDNDSHPDKDDNFGGSRSSSQNTYTMDDEDSTEITHTDLSSQQELIGKSAGNMTTESLTTSFRDLVNADDLNSRQNRLPDEMPHMTSFRQLASESPAAQNTNVTADDSVHFLMPTNSKSVKSRDDQMIAKFIRLDDIHIDTATDEAIVETKPIFPMFIGFDSPNRPTTINGKDIPPQMSQSYPSPVSDVGTRKRALASRLSVSSLTSLSSIDVSSPSNEGMETFPPVDQESSCRLGADLLQMYLSQNDTDITIQTDSGKLYAHRCILSATSHVLNSMLNECPSVPLNLQNYSKTSVHFLMCFLYGRVVSIPPDVDCWQLLAISDQLKLPELTDVVKLHLKAKICHFFHRPCASCVSASFDALEQLESVGHLKELLNEFLNWQARYFGRIWKGRVFLHLNERCKQVCYRHLVDNLCSETVIDVLLGCEKLQVTLASGRSSKTSTDSISQLVSGVLDHTMGYLVGNFHTVIASQSFANQGKGLALNLNLLEDILPALVHSLSADVACKSLLNLNELLLVLRKFEITNSQRQVPTSGSYSLDTLIAEWNERFINLVKHLYELCDRYLLHHAASVVNCDSWKLLSPRKQQHVKEAGIFVEMREARAPPPKLSSLNRTYKRSVSAGVTFSSPNFLERSRSADSSGGGRLSGGTAGRPRSMLPATIEAREREDASSTPTTTSQQEMDFVQQKDTAQFGPNQSASTKTTIAKEEHVIDKKRDKITSYKHSNIQNECQQSIPKLGQQSEYNASPEQSVEKENEQKGIEKSTELQPLKLERQKTQTILPAPKSKDQQQLQKEELGQSLPTKAQVEQVNVAKIDKPKSVVKPMVKEEEEKADEKQSGFKQGSQSPVGKQSKVQANVSSKLATTVKSSVNSADVSIAAKKTSSSSSSIPPTVSGSLKTNSVSKVKPQQPVQSKSRPLQSSQKQTSISGQKTEKTISRRDEQIMEKTQTQTKYPSKITQSSSSTTSTKTATKVPAIIKDMNRRPSSGKSGKTVTSSSSATKRESVSNNSRSPKTPRKQQH